MRDRTRERIIDSCEIREKCKSHWEDREQTREEKRGYLVEIECPSREARETIEERRE